MALYFQKTIIDIIMTEKDENHYRKNIVCGFCEKELNIDKI